MASEDLNLRVQQLSQSLLDKERDLVASRNSHAFLKQDLEAAQAQLSAAREELRNEATKNSLLEQRLKRITDELQQTRNDLASSVSERDTLNRTLGRVHDQLNNLKSESAAKSLQITELQLHYDGVLAAKEESIRSLQALLDSQQKQLLEQQAVWEEQKRSLKASLVDSSSDKRAAAGQLALAQAQAVGAAAQAAALADLRAKLAAAETAALKAAEREHKLIELLRHRERQVVKLKQKRNSQSGAAATAGRNTAGGAAAPVAAASPGCGSGGKPHREVVEDRERGGADALGGGGGRSGGGGGVSIAARLAGARVLFAGGVSSEEDSFFADTATSQEMSAASPLRRSGTTTGGSKASSARDSSSNNSLHLALQEERRRHEAVRSRLASAEREADDLRTQLSRLRAQLAEAAAAAAAGSGGGSNVQLADELLRAHRKIQELETQLRRARDGVVMAASEAAASTSPTVSASRVGGGTPDGSGSGGAADLLTPLEHLALVRQRLVRQRQEFEQLLERVVAGDAVLLRSAPGGVLMPEDVKGLMERHLSRIDTLASMSALPEGRRLGDPLGGGFCGGGSQSQGHQNPGQHQQQYQHSLFVVRAAWSTLRRALMSLQEGVSSSLDVKANPAVAYLQGADFLSRIMREWTVGDKVALDTAVESSMSAAVALVQEAATRLQAHAVDSGVVRQQLQEAQDEVAQLRLTNNMVQAEGDRRLAEKRVELEELRSAMERARSEAAVAQASGCVGREASGCVGREASGYVGREASGCVGREASGYVGREASGYVGGSKEDNEGMGFQEARGWRHPARPRDRNHFRRLGWAVWMVWKKEAAARLSELEAARTRAEAAEAAVQRAEAAAAAADAERNRLRKNLTALEGDKGSAEAAAHSREEERMKLMRALSDANATIALLHDRLDAYQAVGNSQINALKHKIRDVVTALESPSLPQLHAMMVTAAADGDAAAAAADGADLAAAAAAGVGPVRIIATTTAAANNSGTPRRAARRPGGVLSETSLNSLALGIRTPSNGGAAAEGGADDPIAVSGSLVAALDSAAVSCSAALHRLALLEMAHHDVDRGVAAVAAVRAQLASATAEMAAGRWMVDGVSFGDVLLTELLHMLDDSASMPFAGGAAVASQGPSPAHGSAGLHTPRAKSASSAPWAGGGGGGGTCSAMALRAQLAVARDQSQHLMRHLKNMEGLLLALKSALPEWLELATARLSARHRTELSRLRGTLGGQLAALRRDLRDMKASCHATLADTAAAAEEALQQLDISSFSRRRYVTSYKFRTQVRPGGLSYTLVRTVVSAARVLPDLRASCEKIRRDVVILVAERDRVRAAAVAAVANTTLVVRSVAEATPLPEVLVLALLNQLTSPEQGLTPFWCAKLRECVAAQMAAAQAAAAEGVVKLQVEPLRLDVDRLNSELKASKRRIALLQAQAARFLEDSGTALESCRRAAGEAAAAVLDSVMAGVREEVAAVRSQVAELESDSSDVLRKTNAAWSEQLATVRASSSAAVAALEESVTVLQSQLGSEADAYDALKAESEAAVKEAAARVAAEEQRLRTLAAELAAAKERLTALEAAETTLEGENRGLRKALRQREMLAMGLMQQQQQDEEQQQQQQRQRSGAGVAFTSRGGMRDSTGA
ncbi:hypothetical protein VOLCADRAFT_90943 [Volvox carteri f. nagariensis]|uniref:Uncharacterized protein n=1 Tax=Volvox carteri f. nagariensis TaxID=3068 RepID=D8TVS7_VOLCA|nr:uncharacterized protein VOLCADRAFT_90943 [Volvox carteri f. nagariensis]EFJ48246.1 hypothetical protein VOLCADRAFT_90943 [Volvox carteri f. nagariensis]|eukprot:XP_002950500.1 hypothetical protein VOLCADRAFT_90943 [Volvox carteri f. nagariensis]